MKYKNKINLFILFILIMCLLTISVYSVEICFNTTDNQQICTNHDTSIFPQNIDLYEGQNDNFNLFISNPSDNDFGTNLLLKTVKDFVDTNKIDLTQLSDELKFEFKSFEDFYNTLQQSNAIGNISLFTQTELNIETRERTLLLSNKNINWTITLIILAIELIKMIISILIILISMFTFFRLLPFMFRTINRLIFKYALGKVK